jgi:uncharacterized MAPEG superfamily protein
VYTTGICHERATPMKIVQECAYALLSSHIFFPLCITAGVSEYRSLVWALVE